MCFGSDQPSQNATDPEGQQLDGAVVAFSQIMETIRKHYLTPLQAVTQTQSQKNGKKSPLSPPLENICCAGYKKTKTQATSIKPNDTTAHVVTLALHTRAWRLQRILSVLGDTMELQRTLVNWWKTTPGTSLPRHVTNNLQKVAEDTNQEYQKVYNCFSSMHKPLDERTLPGATTRHVDGGIILASQKEAFTQITDPDDLLWGRACEEGLEKKIALLHNATENLLSSLMGQFKSLKSAHLICRTTGPDDVKSVDTSDVYRLIYSLPEKYVLETDLFC